MRLRRTKRQIKVSALRHQEDNKLAHRGLSHNLETALRQRSESAIVMVHHNVRKRTSVRSDANRRLRGFTGRGLFYLKPCPIFSVPNAPIPFSRNAKTTRFSSRSPTLNV